MKVVYSYLLLFFITSSAMSQRAIEGDWHGKINVGVELRMVIHIKKDSAGSFTGTMDSPDQNVKGLALSDVSGNSDSLLFALKMANAKFAGAFQNDTTIAGSWMQGGMSLPLKIVKTDVEEKRNRPQTPKPPFGYASEDVEYDNADKSIHFGGTFTYPSTGNNFSTAILLTGSGQEDRDETIFEHKPFAVIADYLTRLGFAVLRVDDRGMGKTTGILKNATSADFANDAEAGIAYLKTRKETDAKRLGLIGHSEGGYLAALIASRRSDIDFIILLAGPGEKGTTLLAQQSTAVVSSEGVSDEIAKRYESLSVQVMDDAISTADTAAAFKKAWSHYEDWKKTTPAATVKLLGFTDNEGARKVFHGLVEAYSSAWMKYFLQSDASKLLEKVSAKVLALNGEKDIQVLPEPNLKGIATALAKSKSKVHETKMLPGLNHLFQHCKKCTVSEYAELEETFAPEALDAMGKWLAKNVLHR